MEKDEFIAKLQMVYVGDRNAFDEIVGVYDELKKQIHEASIEIQSLIEEDIDCPSNCSKLQELHKKNENQRQELISLNERLKEVKKANGYLKQENQRLNNVLNEIYKFVDWHYEDNKEFFKNKGIGLNYPECDYILKIINELKESDK